MCNSKTNTWYLFILRNVDTFTCKKSSLSTGVEFRQTYFIQSDIFQTIFFYFFTSIYKSMTIVCPCSQNRSVIRTTESLISREFDEQLSAFLDARSLFHHQRNDGVPPQHIPAARAIIKRLLPCNRAWLAFYSFLWHSLALGVIVWVIEDDSQSDQQRQVWCWHATSPSATDT